MTSEKQAIIDAHAYVVSKLNAILATYLADLEDNPQFYFETTKEDAIEWFLESL